jgi:predicted MFS family arabinose efflux permease
VNPLLRQRDFALYLVVNVARIAASQIVAVGVGWQVYAIHRHPFDLGLVGLAEFVPLPLLALPAGHLADHFSRRLVLALSLVVSVALGVGLLAVTVGGARVLWPFLLLSALSGAATALGSPASRALPPELVPAADLGTAFALRSTATQVGTVVGPALGGLLFALRPELLYASATALFVLSLACTLALHRRGGWTPGRDTPPDLTHVLGGISFLRRSHVVLGAILLDLFAVLFGGAVALLPAFARSILHTGPFGLGVLRSAPAVGAIVAGALLTRRPLEQRIGPALLGTVTLFGASMIVFGLSTSFALSLGALAVSGFADMISVNIRSTTVALATPDALRGRVNAVEMVFISASNQLGAFESGTAAALLGTVPAVVAGGVATIVIALVWRELFPSLTRLDRLEELQPEPAA